MTDVQTGDPTRRETLRLWPGMVIVTLQWLVKLGAPIVVSGDATLFEALSGLFGGLGVALWWAFFSRAPRSERWGAAVLTIVTLAAIQRLAHESIRAGAVGFTAVPLTSQRSRLRPPWS